MSFECLADCAQKVRQAGGEFKEDSQPVSSAGLDEFEEQLREATGLPLPPSLRSFWETKGDEYVAWLSLDEESGLLEMAPLREIIGDYLNDRRIADEKLGSWRDRGEPADTIDAMSAYVERMQTWLPFLRIPDGAFVVECESGRVLFQSFHWDLDEPGLWTRVLAPSLEKLLEEWSRFAFTDPVNGFDHPFEWKTEDFPLTL